MTSTRHIAAASTWRVCTLVLPAVLLLAGCATASSDVDHTIAVEGPLRLLPRLDDAVWSPRLINLNNPAIRAHRADLGDGEAEVLFAHPPAALSWWIELRSPVRLDTAVGLIPEAWEQSADGVGFAVRVEGEQVYRRIVDPRRRPEDRAWLPVEIDLRRWTGRRVRLELLTDVGPAFDPAFDWAVWRDPRLAPAEPAAGE